MKIKTIILAGSRDFRGCSLSADVAGCLWPVFGVPAIERLVDGLTDQRIDEVIVCSNGPGSAIKRSIDKSKYPNLRFFAESFPVGSAGCIRQAVSSDNESLLLVFQGSMINPPDIDELVSAHKQKNADLTVFFNPDAAGAENNCGMDNAESPEPAGVYVCSDSVLEHIPQEGYFDIKESLIPALLGVGKKVCHATLSKAACSYRGRKDYIRAMSGAFDGKAAGGLKNYDGLDNVLVGKDVQIDPDARICGPVAVLDGASIAKRAVVLGPAVIGKNSSVGENSVIVRSILWEGAIVSSGCSVNHSIIAAGAVLEDNEAAEGVSVVSRRKGLFNKISSKCFSAMTGNPIGYLAAAFAIIASFQWSYWPNLKDLWRMWMRSDEFSSGLLVPFLAVYILWSRRDKLKGSEIKPAVGIGVACFLLTQVVRLFGTFYWYSSLERLSIVLSIIAMVLLLFGWRFVWKIFAVLAFLFLMLPWPNSVQEDIAQPLQRWATNSAVFSLEMIGYDVVQEGNVIHLGDTTVAVAEACNGLRMITAFFVIIALVVLLTERKRWEKIVVFASSLPIALLCNTVRLVITSIAFTYVQGEYWETMFHDFGGYAMMPLALAIAIGELWLLKKLMTPPQEIEEVIVEKKQPVAG